ncbi:MAG: ferrochelatase, partial [Alphaproteobacteria bacterium]
ARDNGVLAYERAPTVDAGAAFIAGLADLMRASVDDGAPVLRSGNGSRLCPADRGQCPMASA